MELHGFFTTNGRALAVKLSAGIGSLSITRVLSGSGNTSETATALSAVCQTLSVNTPIAKNQSATIPATLVCASAGTDYRLTELGVYADDPDLGEILYKIYRLDVPVEISATSAEVYRFYLKETMLQSLDVSVSCSPAGLITEADFNPFAEKVAATQAPLYHISMDAAALPEYLSSLPRYLGHHYTITVSGTLTEALILDSFFGPGSINIKAAAVGRATLGVVKVVSCQTPISLQNLYFQEPDSNIGNMTSMVSSYGSLVSLANCHSFGLGPTSKAVGFGATEHGRLLADSCSVSACQAVAFAGHNGIVSIFGTSSFTPSFYGAAVYAGGLVIIGNSEISNTLGASTNYKYGGGVISYSGEMV